MPVTDALANLFSLERLGMKFGLENISRLCAALGHPERAFRSILIAGTNGKGSVTAMVHRGLIAAGHRAARYTSPHLERIEERFVIGTGEVETPRLESAAAQVWNAIDGLVRTGALEAPPTFFEAVTATAFELFRQEEVDIAVLEVGLGGRLDATNLATPIAAAITSIDFDHEAQLGYTLESIAFEKAGIIRPGIPVICGPLPPEAERVVREVCRERSARFITAAADPDLLKECQTPALRGAHQLDNARVAARVLRELDGLGVRVDEASICAGVRDVQWAGRLELFQISGCDVLIDAAHNPAGARALAGYLGGIGWTDCALVFGAMEDKNVRAMLAELAPVCRTLICTRAQTSRAIDPAQAADAARGIGGVSWVIEVQPDPAAALTRAMALHPRVVVAGSIFLIGPLRGILRTR